MRPKARWLRRLAKTGAALAGLWGVSTLLYHATAPKRPATPLLIAHRGGKPENTLAAFQNMREFVWETDLRQTTDGVLVLLHDSTVDRTTPGQGRIENKTAAEAAALGIPTFQEFLALANRANARILPEMKGDGLEEATVTALRNAGLLERTTVQCFSGPALERIHALAPELKLCRLYYPWALYVGANPGGVVAVAPNAEALLLNPWLVRQAHGRGWQVWPWFLGLESDLTVRWVLGLGVDGLIVDNPERARALSSQSTVDY